MPQLRKGREVTIVRRTFRRIRFAKVAWSLFKRDYAEQLWRCHQALIKTSARLARFLADKPREISFDKLRVGEAFGDPSVPGLLIKTCGNRARHLNKEALGKSVSYSSLRGRIIWRTSAAKLETMVESEGKGPYPWGDRPGETGAID